MNLDGAFFGSAFPHIFLKEYGEQIVMKKKKEYVPMIYGFKLFKQKGSKYHEEKDVVD